VTAVDTAIPRDGWHGRSTPTVPCVVQWIPPEWLQPRCDAVHAVNHAAPRVRHDPVRPSAVCASGVQPLCPSVSPPARTSRATTAVGVDMSTPMAGDTWAHGEHAHDDIGLGVGGVSVLRLPEDVLQSESSNWDASLGVDAGGSADALPGADSVTAASSTPSVPAFDGTPSRFGVSVSGGATGTGAAGSPGPVVSGARAAAVPSRGVSVATAARNRGGDGGAVPQSARLSGEVAVLTTGSMFRVVDGTSADTRVAALAPSFTPRCQTSAVHLKVGHRRLLLHCACVIVITCRAWCLMCRVACRVSCVSDACLFSSRLVSSRLVSSRLVSSRLVRVAAGLHASQASSEAGCVSDAGDQRARR
jgi:hypothetical protein